MLFRAYHKRCERVCKSFGESERWPGPQSIQITLLIRVIKTTAGATHSLGWRLQVHIAWISTPTSNGDWCTEHWIWFDLVFVRHIPEIRHMWWQDVHEHRQDQCSAWFVVPDPKRTSTEASKRRYKAGSCSFTDRTLGSRSLLWTTQLRCGIPSVMDGVESSAPVSMWNASLRNVSIVSEDEIIWVTPRFSTCEVDYWAESGLVWVWRARQMCVGYLKEEDSLECGELSSIDWVMWLISLTSEVEK